MYYTAKIKKGADGQTCRRLKRTVIRVEMVVKVHYGTALPPCWKCVPQNIPTMYFETISIQSLASHATSKWRILLSEADPILQIRAWGWGLFGHGDPELRRWVRSQKNGAPSPDCGFWKLVSLTAFQSLFFLSVTFYIILRR